MKVRMYVALFVGVAWNFLWGSSVFRMIFRKYWSNYMDYIAAFLFKCVIPLLLVLVVAPKYIIYEKC